MKKLLFCTVLSIFVLSTMLSGCGSTGSKTSAVELIEKTGSITMLTHAEYPPYTFTYDDRYVGVDVEIGRRIAEKLGVTLEVQNVKYTDIMSQTAKGAGHMSIAGLVVEPELTDDISYSEAYTTSSLYALALGSDETITGKEDLSGKVIGVLQASGADFYASEDVASKRVDRYATVQEAIQALLEGKVEAVVVDEQVARAAVVEYESLKLIEEALYNETYVVAVPKDSDLLPVINEVLAELKAEGIIDTWVLQYARGEVPAQDIAEGENEPSASAQNSPSVSTADDG